MIWLEAIPRHFVNPCIAGSTFVPKPPTIARVCQDSRRAALLFGRPYAIDKWEKRPSSCWFTPRCDIIMLPSSIPKTWSHPIFDKSPWQDASSVVVQDRFVHDAPISRKGLKEALELAVDHPQLREIMIWPMEIHKSPTWMACSGSTSYNRASYEMRRWGDETLDDLFGNDFVKVIDLADFKDVANAQVILCNGYDYALTTKMLGWAHKLFIGSDHYQPNYWEELVKQCKVFWLKAHFKAEKENVAAAKEAAKAATEAVKAAAAAAEAEAAYRLRCFLPAVASNNDDDNETESHSDKAERLLAVLQVLSSRSPIQVNRADDIDMSNAWICETLAKMPALRPIVVLARFDHAYVRNKPPYTGLLPYKANGEARSTRGKDEPEPPYVFNDECKKWLKRPQAKTDPKKTKGKKKKGTAAN